MFTKTIFFPVVYFCCAKYCVAQSKQMRKKRRPVTFAAYFRRSSRIFFCTVWLTCAQRRHRVRRSGCATRLQSRASARICQTAATSGYRCRVYIILEHLNIWKRAARILTPRSRLFGPQLRFLRLTWVTAGVHTKGRCAHPAAARAANRLLFRELALPAI